MACAVVPNTTKDVVIVGPASIPADDIFVTRFRSRSSGCRGCLRHPVIYAAFPVYEQGQVFLVKGGLGHVPPSGIDFLWIDEWIRTRWHLTTKPILAFAVLTTIEQNLKVVHPFWRGEEPCSPLQVGQGGANGFLPSLVK